MTIDLHHNEYGDRGKRPLIIVHGLFGSNSNWRTIAKQLAKDYHVIVPDLRNHGSSSWIETMTYAEMADDLSRLVTSNKLDEVTVIGHSMGGKASMLLTQLQLVSVRQLVVVDIAPILYPPSHGPIIQAMKNVDFSAVNARNDVDLLLSSSIKDVATRQFLLQNLTRDESGYRWRINLQAIESNMPSILDYECDISCDTQTLFIGGTSSNYITPEYHQPIQQRFPQSKISMIDGAGHWLHAEKPDQFINCLIPFLQDHH